MKPFTNLTSKVVAIPVENIDTDQIIPARFLKTVSKAGLGKHLFADWRYNPDGAPKPDFVLNRPSARGAQVLLAGDNFGCGSSREHAPWALMDWGFRAVVSTSFADIFANNGLKNGLLPVVVDADTHRQLLDLFDVFDSSDPTSGEPEAELAKITIDLTSQRLVLPDGRQVAFPIDPFNKACLLQGVDPLGYLMRQETHIAAYERLYPPRVNAAIP